MLLNGMKYSEIDVIILKVCVCACVRAVLPVSLSVLPCVCACVRLMPRMRMSLIKTLTFDLGFTVLRHKGVQT